jgi:hypothetical protein
MPQSKLCDDLPAILVVTGGTNLNAISYDEPADPMSSGGFQCCRDSSPIREPNRVEGVGKHFFHCSVRI